MNVTILDTKVGENITIIVDLPDDATGNVTVIVDGKNYTVPVKNGTGNIIIPDLPEGDHNIIINYTGDDKYDGTTTNKTIVVTSNGVNLTASDVVMIYKEGSRLYATLLDSKGNPIANATIFFTINGVTYNRTTDANGSASSY